LRRSAIIGLFVVAWGISTLVYKWRGYDELEVLQAAA